VSGRANPGNHPSICRRYGLAKVLLCFVLLEDQKKKKKKKKKKKNFSLPGSSISLSLSLFFPLKHALPLTPTATKISFHGMSIPEPIAGKQRIFAVCFLLCIMM
jgi:hypothetical protein